MEERGKGGGGGGEGEEKSPTAAAERILRCERPCARGEKERVSSRSSRAAVSLPPPRVSPLSHSLSLSLSPALSLSPLGAPAGRLPPSSVAVITGRRRERVLYYGEQRAFAGESRADRVSESTKIFLFRHGKKGCRIILGPAGVVAYSFRNRFAPNTRII